jgi:holo-[acyl-carrier protein] synthase
VLIGLDLCDPLRIESLYKEYGQKFLSRIFSDDELNIWQDKVNDKNFILRLASRYAAKEAVAKMFECGIGKDLSFREIEILKNQSGALKVNLLAKAGELHKKHRIKEIKISISHERQLVAAVAVASCY